MQWVLFVIFIEANRYYVKPNGVFPSWEMCLEAKSDFLITAPQPYINFDVVCVPTDQIESS